MCAHVFIALCLVCVVSAVGGSAPLAQEQQDGSLQEQLFWQVTASITRQLTRWLLLILTGSCCRWLVSVVGCLLDSCCLALGSVLLG